MSHCHKCIDIEEGQGRDDERGNALVMRFNNFKVPENIVVWSLRLSQYKISFSIYKQRKRKKKKNFSFCKQQFTMSVHIDDSRCMHICLKELHMKYHYAYNDKKKNKRLLYRLEKKWKEKYLNQKDVNG